MNLTLVCSVFLVSCVVLLDCLFELFLFWCPHLLLSAALLHARVLVCCILFVLRNHSASLLISSLTLGLFRNMLFNFHAFYNF
jgi:hypothetical protein